jgi:hypothetical protein
MYEVIRDSWIGPTHFNDTSYIVSEKRSDLLQGGIRVLDRIV